MDGLKGRRFTSHLRTAATRRKFWFIFIAISVILMLGVYHQDTLKDRLMPISSSGNLPKSQIKFAQVPTVMEQGPPKYERIKEFERNLPQHNLDVPYPEGKTGRYVKFTNQIKYLGWNNVFNEILMNNYLAYKSKRAYVFIDYFWKPEYYFWPEDRRTEWPLRTPLNAIISGPTAGGPWDEGDDAPRSVHEDFFEIVCPKEERRVINTRDVKPPIEWEQGDVQFRTWQKLLEEAPERCIEIEPAPREEDGYAQTFDLWLWGSDRVLSLWDEFSKSPVSRLLATSPLVQSAVDRNEYLFFPSGPKPAFPVSRDPYDHMLAMHVRRGDYKDACVGLATWNSTYYSWNLLPELPDHFIPPQGGGWGVNTPENIEKYMVHCLPTFDMIVQKVRDSRRDFVNAAPHGTRRILDVLYLLTNEDSEWLDQLKSELRKDGWHVIRTSRDLILDQEQTDVNMAVDMDIARKAAVFIGNGWSSFTSNIVHRRLVDGKQPISIRFF